MQKQKWIIFRPAFVDVHVCAGLYLQPEEFLRSDAHRPESVVESVTMPTPADVALAERDGGIWIEVPVSVVRPFDGADSYECFCAIFAHYRRTCR